MSRTPSTLATAALLALVAGCSVPIAGGLDESDANRVVVALENGGIAANKEADPERENRWRVSVGRDEASAAVTILQQESLPPPPSPGVLESLGDSSLVPSRTAEHAKWVIGTAGELERSLRGIDGVLSARVHLAVPEKGPLGDSERPEPTASVLVRHRGATPPMGAADVQRLVAGAVPGLDTKQVSVVLAPTPAPSRPPERELSRFGPVTVTRASMLPLRLLVGGAALLNVVLIGSLLALWARVRRTRQELAEARLGAEAARNAQ